MAEPSTFLPGTPQDGFAFGEQVDDEYTWKPLRFLNLYRLTISALFAGLYQLGSLPKPLGSTDPQLFYITSLIYVAFAVLANGPIIWRRPRFDTQVYVHLGVDILAMTVLMHSSGSMESGLGMLLVVTIAAAGMLTEGRTAGLFAALATLAMLTEQAYSHFFNLPGYLSFSRAGMLGATFFATAALARVLANRIRESEALAAQRGVDLANMSRLTEYVIQQMESGVLVVDSARHLRLMNVAAWRLLGFPNAAQQKTLAGVSPELAERLAAWERNAQESLGTLAAADGAGEVLPRFARIGGAGYLIFLDDATSAAQQAQQLKLAALGRLTASIAHEVRNPLGAIGHAGELLGESENLGQADRRLTEIIRQQVQRVNGIIESVLQLGRRDASQPEVLVLQPWLKRFVEEFIQTVNLPADQIDLSVEPPGLAITFDPNHLRQILANLCQNALEHARETNTGPKVSLRTHVQQDRVFLDVIDTGPGVSTEAQAHLFEPFFTTRKTGTGLGLYVSRELAQCNRARLDYLPATDAPGRFRLFLGAPLNPSDHE
ncbi:MAG: HAMP domain-containing sensor histidine kinase [Thiohalomonadaceae bacterium]